MIMCELLSIFKHHTVADGGEERAVALFVDHGEPEKGFLFQQRTKIREHK